MPLTRDQKQTRPLEIASIDIHITIQYTYTRYRILKGNRKYSIEYIIDDSSSLTVILATKMSFRGDISKCTLITNHSKALTRK